MTHGPAISKKSFCQFQFRSPILMPGICVSPEPRKIPRRRESENLKSMHENNLMRIHSPGFKPGACTLPQNVRHAMKMCFSVVGVQRECLSRTVENRRGKAGSHSCEICTGYILDWIAETIIDANDAIVTAAAGHINPPLYDCF